MNITIIGAGAIGTMLATRLSNNVNKIKLIVKPEHTNLRERKTIILREISGEENNIKIDFEDKIMETDLIILAVKSYDLPPIINNLTKMETPLMCCQNGLHTLNFIKKNIGIERLSYLVTGTGSSKVEPGISHHKGNGFTYIGELTNKQTDKIKNIYNSLIGNGMECKMVENISDYIWLKTIINSSINPVATIYRVKNGRLREPKLNEYAKKICEESTKVALETGIKLPLDSWNEVNSIIEKTADNKCSMLQDIENNQMTEIEAINGEIIRIADRKGIPVPYNKKIITEIKNLSINS